jgi:hypothetical protein
VHVEITLTQHPGLSLGFFCAESWIYLRDTPNAGSTEITCSQLFGVRSSAPLTDVRGLIYEYEIKSKKDFQDQCQEGGSQKETGGQTENETCGQSQGQASA